MDSPISPSSVDASRGLAVSLLGRFAVAVDGVELAEQGWPSLRATHLVQLLSLQPRLRMTRDEVIDALWPQLDPDAGAANLRKATHHARQALGRHDAIVLQAGEVLLWPERPITVDALDFERRADAALAGADAAACAEAAEAYAGDVLPGARFEPWTESTRERLRARHFQLLRASAQWERLAQLEPDDEPSHRALMQRELDAGNRAAALRWYAHLREALQQGLGVAPDAQTEALYERCVAGLQADRPGLRRPRPGMRPGRGLAGPAGRAAPRRHRVARARRHRQERAVPRDRRPGAGARLGGGARRCRRSRVAPAPSSPRSAEHLILSRPQPARPHRRAGARRAGPADPIGGAGEPPCPGRWGATRWSARCVAC